MIDYFLKKFSLKPISILVVVLVAVWRCIENWPNTNESMVKFWISLAFWIIVIMVYSGYILFELLKETAPKNALGVLFVFHAENKDLYNEAKFNLISNFNSIAKSFNNQLIPICKNANNFKNYSIGNRKLMEKLLIKSNCIFSVDIIYVQ